MIAEDCLTFFNFRCFRELSRALSLAPLRTPLVGYASYYYGKHMKRERRGSVNPLALRLLLQFGQHISSQLLLLRYHADKRWREP